MVSSLVFQVRPKHPTEIPSDEAPPREGSPDFVTNFKRNPAVERQSSARVIAAWAIMVRFFMASSGGGVSLRGVDRSLCDEDDVLVAAP
jgi:hypothetical protein